MVKGKSLLKSLNVADSQKRKVKAKNGPRLGTFVKAGGTLLNQ